MSYNPKPTRVWSRVQHPCTFTLDSSYNSVFSALTGKTTSPLEADYYNKLLYKGNILQYKKNTSNLTKSQRYSQICKGMWTNRTKTFATQTQTYTNPNTSNLKRVNFIRVPTNGNTTYIHGPYNFNIPAPNGCISDSIKDGGSLLCNTTVNPCTNEVIEITKVLECYPTSCSDVPGPIIDLCWNSKIDTWYPKQNLTMPTSGTKWPEGYKGFVSAVSPYAPYLIVDSTICNSITLSWNVLDNNCIPISSYNIYQNGVIIQNVPYTTTSITISGLTQDTRYSFYVTSLSNTIESSPSNTILFNNIFPFTTTGGSVYYTVDSNCNYVVTFTGSGSITFFYNVTITEAFLVGGGNAGLTGKYDDGANGGWGGAGGGFAILNNTPVSAGIPIILTVGAGGVYPVSYAIQSSFTYNSITTLSVKDSDDWAGTQNNEGGLNNQNFGVNHVAQDGYQYDGVWYGGGGGYGGSVLASLGIVGGNGGLGGGGGGGGYSGSNGGSGGQGTGGTAGNVTVPAGGSSIYGGGGGYGIITGNGGNGGAGGGGAGGAGGVGAGGFLQAGGGGGGGVNTGGGGGGGAYPQDSGIPGNGGSGIIIIKFTV
jgi:hypothetical protein